MSGDRLVLPLIRRQCYNARQWKRLSHNWWDIHGPPQRPTPPAPVARSVAHHTERYDERDRLLAASALGAMHNSGERFDAPKCHPNTRTAVLEKIADWCIGRVGWDMVVLWLYGPAGAGKSAITQTFAEQCALLNGLLASFFFSRSDPKRNNEKSLVATLAYQISLRIPRFWDIIAPIIDRDPAIFQLNFETQFQTLVIEPLLHLSTSDMLRSGQPHPYLIIIDGLDECQGSDVQTAILYTISKSLQQHRFTIPIMFLIASRPEHHLNIPFNDVSLRNLTLRLALDDTYHPDADIGLYLVDSFRQIRHTHIMQAHIPESWPSENDITKLVEKSSGQFIYAATVIRYVSSPRHNPLNRLKVVQGLFPDNYDMPFAQLDALYTNILSRVDDIHTTLRVLGIYFTLPSNNITTVGDMERFMLLSPGTIPLFLHDLHAVVDASDMHQPFKFLHASFSDFLLDSKRSFEFHININSMHLETARLCMAHINLALSTNADIRASILASPRPLRQGLFLLNYHLQQSGPLHVEFALREAILNLPYIQSLMALRSAYQDSAVHCGQVLAKFLNFLKNSNFSDTRELLQHHQCIWDQMMLKDLEMVPKSHGLAFWIAYLIEVEDVPLGFFFQTVMALPSSAEAPGATIYVPHSLFNGALHYHVLDGHPHLSSELEPNVHYYNIDLRYLSMLRCFLTDPLRAGVYTADKSTYIKAAEFVLAFAVRPWDKKKKQIRSLRGQWDFIWDAFTHIIPKAGYSDDIVQILSRDDLIFFMAEPAERMRERLQSTFRAFRGYLLRYTGSVPPQFRIRVDRALGNPYDITEDILSS